MSIALGNGKYGFGMVLHEPLIGYFDYIADDQSPALGEIMEHPFVFKLWTMNHAVTRGTWPVIGRADPSQVDATDPWCFREDPFTGKLTKTQDSVEWFPVSEEECLQMERAAVWEPEHVADRLRDYIAGVPNKWFESSRLRPHKNRPVTKS